MATIKDVAKRANVSTTTVSHVINKTRFVAEETRNAVWAAIKELHYSPSAVARSLKVNHTKSIGLLATSSEAAYFAEIIEAVEKSCFQKGYTLILGNAWNDRKNSGLSVDDGAKARRRPAGDVFRISGIGAQHAGRVPPYSDGGDGLG
jgi:DNA-binding LacI/PurR family transcriptional regulator